MWRRWRWRWMMSGRVRMMMGMRRRVWMRMMLHLTRPGGCRWALVVLRRHLASGARAPGGVTAAPAAHAAEVTRRRAARHRTSAPCNKREPGTVSELLRISRPSPSSYRVALLYMQLHTPEWDQRRKLY